ncbi:hypothetical protein EDC01DRAFT_670516 [Geopyxis carbonaria]|nr:hypothetical protein EDC01DRAFT_670516 [Geopyxis carbonaria]
MARGVRGPNSALTEFLRERGVNATEIRNRALAAAAAAAQEADANGTSSTTQTSHGRGRGRRTVAPQEGESSTVAVAVDEEAVTVTVAVTKKGKAKGKGKKRKRDDDDSDGDDDFNPYEKSIPTPGQIAFCFECESRFTVTPYSKASSDGDGLLCSPCGRQTAKQDQAVKKKRTTGRRVKREVARAALDGRAIGAKSLKEMCIQAIAGSIGRFDALGPIHNHDIDRLCQIISRNRSLNNETLKLFTATGNDSLTLYDCARIDEEGLFSLGVDMPELHHLSLQHAGRATDEVLRHYAKNLRKLTSFHIQGAFLVSRQAYIKFVEEVGPRLKALTISSTARTNLAVIQAIADNCKNLEHLNLPALTRFDDECLKVLSGMTNLKSLDISHAAELHDDAVVEVLNSIGSGLESLNISGNPLLSAPTASSIHACCAKLRVLNINECELLGDTEIYDLFTNWGKNKGLVELHMMRLIGLGDLAVQAVAQHSGEKLEVLDINSCHLITKEGLLAVLHDCRRLSKFDTAFLRSVDDEVVELMQQVGIKNIAVWGCNRVTECAKVGQGVVMIGRESDIIS